MIPKTTPVFFLALAWITSHLAIGANPPAAATAAPPPAPPLSYTSTWLGNSYGQGDGKWIQNNILGLHVTSEGTVYTNSWWDEGRRESGIYSGNDGDPIRMLESLHDSFGGGFAVTGDDSFIYASNWDSVRRCTPAGKPAPFPNGLGVHGDTFKGSTHPTGDNKGVGVRGLAVDKARQRLFVSQTTDNGPDQTIKIYQSPAAHVTKPDATFGSSVYAGTPGQITNAKLGSSGLTGVAVDAAGNYYVSMNGVGPQSFWHGGGTVLESWSPSGELRWRKLGLAFVDCADADQASDGGDSLDVYDKYSHYRLDLKRTTAGTEWTYAGRTLNPIKYPADPRFLRAADGWDYSGGTFVRNVHGHKLLYVLSMQARRLLIYRFDPTREGETAIPAGIWESQANYKAGYPGCPPANDFFWRDKNANGAFDADEFAAGPGMPNLGFGMWVDSNGDLFSCNHWAGGGVGIRRWKMQGFDATGNPIYDYSAGNYTEFQRPDGSHGELRRIEYFPESDTMFVASTSLSDGDRDAGNRIVKYDHWSTPRRSLAWTLDPPMDKTKISAISVAGDYLFLGYSYFGSNSREGTIRIHRLSDASYVGEMIPTPAVGSLCGTFDIPYAIRAYQTRGGEYLVFAEDDHYAKVIVHRWNPHGPTLVDTLDDLKKTDPTHSSSAWGIDATNKEFFSMDASRAMRTSDTPQALAWHKTDLTNFSASIYFDMKLNIDSLVSMSASADGTDWQPVKTTRTAATGSGGGWNVSTFRPAADPLPEATQYLRIEIAPSGVNWNVQIGRVELFGSRSVQGDR